MKTFILTALFTSFTTVAFAENYSIQCRDAYSTTVTETKKGNKVETKISWKGGKASLIEWGNQKWTSPAGSVGVVPNERYYFTTAAIQYTSDGGSVPSYNVYLTCAKITNH